MFGLISAIIAAIVGFGAGAAGLGKVTLPGQTSPVVLSTNTACYDPQLNVKLTLRYPEDFTNVSDKRAAINPNLFGAAPSAFNSTPDCQNLVMANKQQRTYIRVRENVRISSCKTDELAGPLGKGICPGWGNNAVELSHRGSCSIDGYTDLRKVADATTSNGRSVEIFWNPFSYNVGCNYKQDNNCGPGERRNINLKDFIYVLNSRDAYIDPDNPNKPPNNEGCPVQWDAGSANYDACSHHFDVYMAEDLYQASKGAPATDDPESPYYFIKQVLENCAEKTMYIPAPEANMTVPPLFLKSPFIWTNDKNIYSEGKIIPTNAQENINYTSYVWTFPDPFYVVKTASTTNLLRLPTDEIAGPFKFCSANTLNPQAATTPTITPEPPPNKNVNDCYDSLGNIFLKDEKGQLLKFMAYSKAVTPQTFTFIKENDPAKGYVYTITDKDYPENNRNDKSLQLRSMQMLQRNMWTWATPWCKPAIYMYPQETTSVNVKLDLDGQLTVSSPTYDREKGWDVVAEPSGKLVTPLTLSDYPYLYYEADLKGVNIPKEGFVYSREELAASLKSLMTTIGFNEKETADFLAYWLPKLTEKPYYFVTLLPEDVINQKEKLTFSVNPDTLIRSRFVFEGLDAPISVKSPSNIASHSRSGFTVTDWGGTIVGKSCTDVTVK